MVHWLAHWRAINRPEHGTFAACFGDTGRDFTSFRHCHFNDAIKMPGVPSNAFADRNTTRALLSLWR